jgi:uncharacterized protein YkwD
MMAQASHTGTILGDGRGAMMRQRTAGGRWLRLGSGVLAGLWALLTVAVISVGAEPAGQSTDDAQPATPQPATPQPDPAARARRSLVDDVVTLTNAARAQEGLAPLQPNEALMRSAQDYAVVLAPGDCFAHDCPPFPSQKDRIAQAGYGPWQRIGENIAAGDRTAEGVVNGWLQSPGHRANILKPEYTEIGVGVATGDGKYHIYWVQVFGTPR